MEPLINWLYGTWASHLVNDYRWSWPIAESIHFSGLVVLAGTVGAFDLRLLGVGKGIAPATLHRLLKYGVAGFVLMAITGMLFISGAPEQYFYNKSFHLKVVALSIMGINAAVFYSRAFRTVSALGPDDDAPTQAKIIAGISITALVLVMLFGRMLTFFRPPY